MPPCCSMLTVPPRVSMRLHGTHVTAMHCASTQPTSRLSAPYVACPARPMVPAPACHVPHYIQLPTPLGCTTCASGHTKFKQSQPALPVWGKAHSSWVKP